MEKLETTLGNTMREYSAIGPASRRERRAARSRVERTKNSANFPRLSSRNLNRPLFPNESARYVGLRDEDRGRRVAANNHHRRA